jgi:hypothetical protein
MEPDPVPARLNICYSASLPFGAHDRAFAAFKGGYALAEKGHDTQAIQACFGSQSTGRRLHGVGAEPVR